MALNAWELVALCGVLAAARSGAASQEADPLQQALLLVDLLKTEYTRVKEENIILRKRELMFRSVVDDETCATTEPNETTSPIIDGRRSGVHLEYLLTPIPAVPQRNLYKSRRQEYEDAFGPHPGGDNPKSTITSSALPITETTKQTSNKQTSMALTSVSASKSTTEEQSTTATGTHSKFDVKIKNPVKNEVPTKDFGYKKIRLSHKMAPSKTTRDPVVEQVASEIMSEMKDYKRPKVKKYAFYSAPLLSPKTERMTKFENFTRGTMRIHQATSKRYPLPLPENNAFCFFHPDSALCRTLI